MPIEDRRTREREARRQLIITTARRLAEDEGWDAVTTRRLSTEIEYSQPVLYTHFANMDELARAVAIDGFAQLTRILRDERADATTPDDALRRLARAYVEFGRQNPALYDVMFTRSTTLPFATDDTPPELEAGFAELREVVAGHDDADTFAEVLWSALHGLVTLGRSHRLRATHDDARLDLLLAQLSA